MIVGCVGSMTKHETARFAIRSSTGDQLAPALSVRQTPPPTLAAQIVLGEPGWGTIARVRPPMLPGPSEAHPVWLGCNPAVRGTAGLISEDFATCGPVGMPAICARMEAPRDRVLSSWLSAFWRAFGGMTPFSSRS